MVTIDKSGKLNIHVKSLIYFGKGALNKNFSHNKDFVSDSVDFSSVRVIPKGSLIGSLGRSLL